MTSVRSYCETFECARERGGGARRRFWNADWGMCEVGGKSDV